MCVYEHTCISHTGIPLRRGRPRSSALTLQQIGQKIGRAHAVQRFHEKPRSAGVQKAGVREQETVCVCVCVCLCGRWRVNEG